jgi:VanZ family protein
MLSYAFQYKFSILLAMVIAILSLLPDTSMPHTSLFSIRFFDKIVHFSMYAAVGFTSLLESRCKSQCARYYTVLLLIILLMSAVIEVLQATLVETRSAEWLDLLANAAGLFSGYLAFRILALFKS